MKRLVDLSRRSIVPEWLDGADINPVDLEKVLRDLAAFNGALLGHYPLLRWLGRAMQAVPRDAKEVSKERPLTLVDVGCGYGDLLRAIRRWSRRQNLPLNLVGVDLNRETIRIARAATDSADRIEFRAVNIFDLVSSTSIDLMVSGLVTHHLSDREIVDFLCLMERVSKRGWAICDLQRNRFLYHFIGLASRAALLHPMICHDGQISVMRSLTRLEWEHRIAEAGILLADAPVRWFMFRFLIGRLR
jgi:2-polyprenyl-3-methyl-5-hydroxy-6-metoxy-1,4-benzoquinol methylase